MARHVGEHPELFPRVLDHLLRLVLFEDCPNQWSISRPMLGLILTNQKVCSPEIWWSLSFLVVFCRAQKSVSK